MTDRTVSRRHMLSVSGAALASTLARPAIGQGRTKLIVQSYGGIYEQVLRESVIPEFEKQHGYEVTLALDDDPTIMSKLVLARGRAPYDVVSVDNNTAVLADSLGLWASDQSVRLSNIGAIYDSCKPPLSRNYAYVIWYTTVAG
jgi:putative spermidine/putrescine transport system substrate-binding protein